MGETRRAVTSTNGPQQRNVMAGNRQRPRNEPTSSMGTIRPRQQRRRRRHRDKRKNKKTASAGNQTRPNGSRNPPRNTRGQTPGRPSSISARASTPRTDHRTISGNERRRHGPGGPNRDITASKEASYQNATRIGGPGQRSPYSSDENTTAGSSPPNSAAAAAQAAHNPTRKHCTRRAWKPRAD
jgi:hypothetical protein